MWRGIGGGAAAQPSARHVSMARHAYFRICASAYGKRNGVMAAASVACGKICRVAYQCDAAHHAAAALCAGAWPLNGRNLTA